MLLPILPDRALRIVLVGIIVLFLINRLQPRTFELTEHQGDRLAAPVGALAGAFQGAAGISGPIVTPWFLSVGISRDAFMFSIASVFAVSGLVQIIGLIFQGLYTPTFLVLSAALIPLSYLVFPLGKMVRERVSVEAFERIVLVLLAVSAISLVVKLL